MFYFGQYITNDKIKLAHLLNFGQHVTIIQVTQVTVTKVRSSDIFQDKMTTN